MMSYEVQISSMVELALTYSSVVLLTQNAVEHATHESLANKDIIPTDFKIHEANYYSSTSRIQYSNGFSITTDPNSIEIINQSHYFTNEEKKNSLILLKDIVMKYIGAFKRTIPESVEINFQFVRDDLLFDDLIEKTIKSNNSYLNFKNHKGSVNSIGLSYGCGNKWFNVTINKIQKNYPSKTDTPPPYVTVFNVNVNYPGNYDEKHAIVSELIESFEKLQQFIGNI